jgi:hypothetical protein
VLRPKIIFVYFLEKEFRPPVPRMGFFLSEQMSDPWKVTHNYVTLSMTPATALTMAWTGVSPMVVTISMTTQQSKALPTQEQCCLVMTLLHCGLDQALASSHDQNC